MWLPSQQSTLTELVQTALIKLCSENIPFEGHLELDGLVCISNGDVSRQIVVKIHKVRKRVIHWSARINYYLFTINNN